MRKNQNQVMGTLSEREQRSVIGGYFPPPKDENKSLIEQIFDEVTSGLICLTLKS